MSSATSFGLISVDGGTNSQTRSQAGVEANLDIQYTGTVLAQETNISV
jgi:tripeptidyl-peptidase-1